VLTEHVIYTEFQPQNDGISQWLSFCAGGTIFASVENEHDHLAEVLASIQKYQIGVLMNESKAELNPGSSGLLLTQSMLRRFDNPMEGVYTAIGGNVYNLTKYVDNHPGGALAIQAVAGRDGTKEFSRHHGLDLMDKPEFAALKVGRYIEERDQGNVDEDEIVLHDLIFNISGERPPSQSCLLKLSKC
jgi:cytochrome b involved in lipid metabolism